MLRTLTALACLAALAAAVGCGKSDREQAREVSQDYVDARNASDFEAVCDLFSESFKQQLGTADCAAFVAEQSGGAEGAEDLQVVDVRVRNDAATADIDVTRESQGPSRIGIRLELQDDGNWRITGLQ
jgi:ketosteroid isomerase-like protein